MKTFIYGCILILYSMPSYSQSLSNQVLASGGTTIEVPQVGSISWTMGELFFETYRGDIHLTQGFHQAYNVVINSLANVAAEASTFRVFPNPATDRFFVEPTTIGKVSKATLFNLIGQPLQQILIDGKTAIDMSNYPAGMYLLQIHGNIGKRQSYKIQKQ